MTMGVAHERRLTRQLKNHHLPMESLHIHITVRGKFEPQEPGRGAFSCRLWSYLSRALAPTSFLIQANLQQLRIKQQTTDKT